MKILVIESTTPKGEIALLDGGIISSIIRLPEENSHGKDIASAVGSVLENASVTIEQIEAVCMDVGPGSYTGIRVAIAYAMGIALAREIPIYGAVSLKSMAMSFFAENPSVDKVTIYMDAKWDELYTATYNKSMTLSSPISMVRKNNITLSDAIAYCPDNISSLFAELPGISKCVYPNARNIGLLASVDKLSPEPLYVRELAPQIKL